MLHAHIPLLFSIISQTIADPTARSNLETFIHLLKSSLGTGILAMPKAFSYVGLAEGAVLVYAMGAFCVYGLHLLVSAPRNSYHPSFYIADTPFVRARIFGNALVARTRAMPWVHTTPSVFAPNR